MYYFVHFDPLTHIGVIDNKSTQMIVVPPYDADSLREIKNKKRFAIQNQISRAGTIDIALSEVKCESHVQVLDTISKLWAKQRSGSGSSLSIEKSTNLLIKHFQDGQKFNRLFNSDFIDLIALKKCFGLPEEIEKRLMSNAKNMDENDANRLVYIMKQPQSYWRDDVETIVDYLNRVVIPSARFDEARNTIVAIKSHAIITDAVDLKINDYLSVIRKESIKKAVENGDSLAKSWQKYSPTNAGFKYRKDNNQKSDQESKNDTDQSKKLKAIENSNNDDKK